MQYSKLGSSDLEVSRCCLGTMTWGEQNTEAEGHEQMDFALDQGVQFWDTAELYAVPTRKETQGSTETIIGNWFKKTGRRQEVVLATKVTGPSPNLSYIRDPLKFNREQIMMAIEGSLKRLQTDFIDLFWVHVYDEDTPIEETMRALDDLVRMGKIHYIGISDTPAWVISAANVLSELRKCLPVSAIQV